MRCTVATCANSAKKAKMDGAQISFHSFPKDPKIRKDWVVKCKREGKWNPNSCHICSEHFAPEDFKRDLQAELLGYRPIRRLHSNAVPTLNLPMQSCKPLPPSVVKRRAKYEAMALKELHNTTIEAILQEDPGNDENMTVEETAPDYRTLYEEEKERTKILEAKIASLSIKIEELERHIKSLDDKKAQSIETEVENALTKVFSKNQVALLLNKRKWVHWTSDEISKAFTLRYLGKRAYIYLKSELKFPLPGMSSLQRWASKIEMRHGILKDVMRVLRMTAEGMDDLQRLTVLLFDEMKVASTLEYDTKHDEIVGPNSSMMVVMARGLCGKWKQPVYVDFDQKMTKAIFLRIITELHQAGYKVVSCVSDMGGGNIGLWKELGISHLAPHFAHPVTQDPVFYFPDVPHLFKLLRNWLLDTGFVLEDGKSVTRQPLDSLLQLTSTEMSVCHKLHEGHLTCEGSQRQNVRLATQLLSHTTATALLHYLPGPSSDLARDTGRFIDLMNDWFDLMNVYTPSNSLRPSLCAYGKRVEDQIALLDEVYQTVHGMRCCGKQSLQLFQRGILMSITSLKQLWEYGRSCGVAYILTSKLNQDALENLFSQLRTRGGLHDHPAPLNALNRLRMIILGKNPGAVQTRVNGNVAADEEFVFAAAVRAADLDSTDLSVTISHVTSSETDTDKEVVSWSPNPRKNVPNQGIKPMQAVGELGTESTEDAMEYFAGWLAKKHKGSHPHLGTNGENLKCHDYALPSWVSHLSYGGLISPSAAFKEQVLKMEKYFQEFVGPYLPKRKKTVKSLKNKIMEKMDNGEIDEKIVKAFVKHRVGIRLKYLKNKGLLGEVKAKAKFQKLCKMKKTVT